MTTLKKKRPTGGSRKGIPNKSTKAVRDIINKIIPAEERYGLLAELARGIWVKEKDKRGETRTYLTQPSESALRTLCEYADGKPVQRIEGDLDIKRLLIDV